jgi:hypothetical protein
MSERLLTKSCPSCAAVWLATKASCGRCGASLAGALPHQASGLPPMRILLGLLAAFVLLAFLAIGGVAFAFSELLKLTTAYEEALRIAQAFPEVQDALGTSVHASAMPFGVAFSSYRSHFTEFPCVSPVRKAADTSLPLPTRSIWSWNFRGCASFRIEEAGRLLTNDRTTRIRTRSSACNRDTRRRTSPSAPAPLSDCAPPAAESGGQKSAAATAVPSR